MAADTTNGLEDSEITLTSQTQNMQGDIEDYLVRIVCTRIRKTRNICFVNVTEFQN